MKNLFVLAAFSAVVGCTNRACDVDITNYEWELKYVETGGEKCNNTKGKSAYVLQFNLDTVFGMNTPSNLAGGFYEIEECGDIIVHTYHNLTEAGEFPEDVPLNTALYETFGAVTEYTLQGKKLTFSGSRGTVVFREIQ